MSLKSKSLDCFTIDHGTIATRLEYNTKTGHVTIRNSFTKSSGYNGGSKKNKECTTYLGCNIAEQILAKSFGDKVRVMPYGNKGYDFLCSKEYKIDVKSSCYVKNQRAWKFEIKRNQTADYFICIAFDNRVNLTPLHVWLIPNDKINHLICLYVAESKLNKWSQYEQSLDKVILCCDTLRETYE